MKEYGTWGAIILFPVAVLGGLWGLRRDLTQPHWIWPTQMAVSPAARSQTAHPALPHGLTQQPPVEGTLARGTRAFHYAATEADRQRAGRELRNPLQPTPKALQQGQQVYATFCLPCHGATGNGDGPLIPKYPNPPNLHSKQSKQLRDGEMFHIITWGRKKMASYASQVPWEDRWRVILYIRQLQKQ